MVLVNSMKYGQTIVPNVFIDKYIARANGEYIKVYLMLLRLIDRGELSVSGIADELDVTEKDIIRALKYWNKEGLISVTFEGDVPTKIDLIEVGSEKKMQDSSAACESAGKSRPAVENANEKKDVGKKKTVRKFSETLVSEDFKQLMFVAEQYFSRPLRSTDTEFFVYLLDDKKFSVELIETLIEYCASIKKTNVTYMKAVAENWVGLGIKDSEEAKKQIQEFQNKGNFQSGKNSFNNFSQRNDDLNAIIGKELKDAT